MFLSACVWLASVAQQQPFRFEEDIKRFEAADAKKMPEPGGIVFTGSSSIVLWKTLATDFPGLPIINRGFGGSQISEVNQVVDRVVTKYQPRLVVLFAGTNDLAGGVSGATVAAEFSKFVRLVRAKAPEARIAYISISPAPSRWKFEAEMRTANKLIQLECSRGENLAYIDVFHPMLSEEGKPRPELFVQDQLHLNADGYAIWKKVVGPFLPWSAKQ